MKSIQVSSATSFDFARRIVAELFVRAHRVWREDGFGLMRRWADITTAWRRLCGQVDLVAEQLPHLLSSPVVPVVIRSAFASGPAVAPAAEVFVERLPEAPRLADDAVFELATHSAQRGRESAEKVDSLHASAATNIDAATYALDRLIADLMPHMALASRGRGEVLPLVMGVRPRGTKARAAQGRVSRAA